MERFTFSATGAIEGNTLSGIAHVFGQRTSVGGRYVTFAAGAFDQALAKSDVRAFWNHDTTLLLGRQSSGTLRVSADREALRYSIDLPDTSYVRDMKVLIDRGDLREMSFGVMPGRHTVSKAPDGKQVWTYSSVEDLFDVSPVSLPAFTGTAIQLHSMDKGESLKSQLIMARQRAAKGTK